MNPNKKYIETNAGMKMNHIAIKTIFIIKAAPEDHPGHYQSPEEDKNSETHVEHKYMK